VSTGIRRHYRNHQSGVCAETVVRGHRSWWKLEMKLGTK
jgi:hypothetical protein